MKRLLFLPLFALLLLLPSCLDRVHSDFTPEIGTSALLCSNGDTLKCRYSGEKAAYVLDTFAVADTLRFAALFNAMGNNLLSTTIKWDTACLDLKIGPLGSIAQVLTSASDTTNGIFYYEIGYNFVSMPVTIVPKKASSSKVSLSVVTDSKFSPAMVDMLVTAE